MIFQEKLSYVKFENMKFERQENAYALYKTDYEQLVEDYLNAKFEQNFNINKVYLSQVR